MKNNVEKKRLRISNALFLVLFCVGVFSSACRKKEDVDWKPKNPPGKIQTTLFTNNYHETSSFARLKVERAWIYYPGDDDWHYAHHPSIIRFKDKFVAIFSNGIHGEDEGSQRILFSTSSDGKIWNECKLLDATDENHSLTSGGLYVSDKGELVAYYTISDYDDVKLYQNSRQLAKTTKDGVVWSEMIDFNFPLFCSHSPELAKESKRLLMTGGSRMYYTDDLSGLSGWKLAKSNNVQGNEKPGLVEGDFLEVKDSIYILFRDVKYRTRLWQRSSANGEEWTAIRKTKFTNAGSKFHFGKLPDGNYYYVGTPDSLRFKTRDPLVLSISEDGLYYDKNYIIAEDVLPMRYKEGRWKDGQFGYPHTIVHEGHLYVIVSRNKESIELIKIPLSQIND